MKRVPILFIALTLAAPLLVRAQDPATEEKINKLSGQIEDLIASQKALQKQLSDLSREIENVREAANKPNASYASQEDLRKLADSVKEIDKKRQDDYEKIRTELQKLGKTLTATPPPPRKPIVPTPADTATSGGDKPKDEKGYEYVIQSGDTLSIIAQAYKEKSIKVSVAQILKANPGLDATKLRVGQKIFIPAPPQT